MPAGEAALDGRLVIRPSRLMVPLLYAMYRHVPNLGTHRSCTEAGVANRCSDHCSMLACVQNEDARTMATPSRVIKKQSAALGVCFRVGPH